MSEETPQEMEQPAQKEEEVSWEDAMEDLQRQKEIANEQAASKAVTPREEEKRVSLENELANLQFILDIPLQVTVELGRKRLIVHDLLQLNQGSVIELTKQIGEPFEVLVNHKLIARGEIVVINDKFGVRITDIISPMERVQQLQ